MMLSRKPPALSLKAEPTISEPESVKHHAIKWKQWLAALMSTAKGKLAKRQAQYKLDFDKRLRRNAEIIHPGDQVFVRKEYTNPQVERKHKLSSVADGPYDVVEVNQGTFVIETEDRFRERHSRDRVTLAPRIVDTSSFTRITPANSQTPTEQNPQAESSARQPGTSGTDPTRRLADLLTEENGEEQATNTAVWIRLPPISGAQHPCIRATADNRAAKATPSKHN